MNSVCSRIVSELPFITLSFVFVRIVDVYNENSIMPVAHAQFHMDEQIKTSAFGGIAVT